MSEFNLQAECEAIEAYAREKWPESVVAFDRAAGNPNILIVIVRWPGGRQYHFSTPIAEKQTPGEILREFVSVGPDE